MKQLINRVNSIIMRDHIFANKIVFNRHGYYIHQRSKRANYKVTVILPIYNDQDNMTTAIDSIINQTMNFEDIELLIIDDASSDQSRVTALKYAKQHANITPIFLKNNSGSPAYPRNLGIELARGKYVMFLDSDDWLDENGIQTLHDLMEETQVNYAVGKTMKVTNKGQFVIGEYNSWTTRKAIDPMTIDQVFHHLAPTGRMIHTQFVRDNGITFPDMTFAEDKQFFIDVLINCDVISTSDAVIYYANRYPANKSFTTTTSVFEKTHANLQLLDYVVDKGLPEAIERKIVNRIYEFDCITRLFDREHFLKSNDKASYYNMFDRVLDTAKSLNYDFKEDLRQPWHKLLVTFFTEERYDDMIRLIQWSRHERIKDYRLIDNLPYYILPFDEDDSLVRMNMLAVHHDSVKHDNYMNVTFAVYGEAIDEVESLVLRKRDDELIQLEFSITRIGDHEFEVSIPYDQLGQLSRHSYALFVTYQGYKKIPIKMDTRQQVAQNDKNIDFYTTVADNLGVSVK